MERFQNPVSGLSGAERGSKKSFQVSMVTDAFFKPDTNVPVSLILEKNRGNCAIIVQYIV